MAATLAFQQAYTQGGSRNSGWGIMDLPVTVASAAGQERLVAILSITNESFSDATFANVSIDGQAATQVGTYSRVSHGDGNGNNGPIASLWRAAGTANTSINVSLSIGVGTVYEIRAAVWTLNNAGTLYDFTAGYIDNPVSGSLSLDIDTVASGTVAGALLAYGDSSHFTTWGGLTERYNGSYLYSGDWISVADLNVSSSSTPLIITVGLNGFQPNGTGVVGFAASFNSAGAAATTITATSLAAGVPAIAGGTFAQKQALAAAGLVASTPALGAAAVVQRHVLVATSLATGIPTLGVSAFVQSYTLAATPLVASPPALPSPSLAQSHGLTATALAVSAPVLPQLLIGLAGEIVATAVAAGAPVLGIAALGQKQVLVATGLAAGTPVIGSALLGRVLAAVPLAASGPVIGKPALGLQSSSLVATPLVVTPVIGAASLKQRHTMVGAAAVAGRPLPGMAHLNLPTGQIPVLAAPVATGRPALAAGVLGQTHRINALAAAAGRPELQRPRPRMLFALLAANITTTAPELGVSVVKRARHPPVATVTLTGQLARPGSLEGRLTGAPTITGRLSRAQMSHPEEV